MRKRDAGFSVIELLIIGGIIAVLTAIAIVSYSAALDRARQKRTVNDIRIIAQAWEARATETHSYALAGYTFPTSAVTYDALASVLRPTYLRELPRIDGWSRPLQFAAVPGSGTSAGEYGIRSAGRDGTFETSYTPGVTNDPDCDIVWATGAFVTYPDTVQGR